MKVKCVDNENIVSCLTVGKIYLVLEETETCYKIIDDKNVVFRYYKYRFVIVDENNIVNMARKIGEMVEKKDRDYNSEFAKAIKEYGNITYFLLVDSKLNRLKSLLLNNNNSEVNESVEYMLKDIVGYTLLMLKEVKNN